MMALMAARPFVLSLPATSANLGPAFDAAGLALGFALRVKARVAEVFSVRASGRDAEICARVDNHLILNVYRQTLDAAGRLAPPLALELENAIPIGKGCGSSAAARLAGLALAVRFGGLAWSAEDIFAAAAALEGHPDNVAACWWGGLVVSRSAGAAAPPTAPATPAPPTWLRVPLRRAWRLLVAVPADALPTERAREVLPAVYSRQDAVANLQNALLLVEALHQGRGDLLAAALADRWHQPYRAALCPLLPALQPLAGTHGILGVALSGAGPSVLLFLDDQARVEASAAVNQALGRAGLQAELLETQVQTRGPGMNWGRWERPRA
jgi:homoserine kinase